MADETLYPSFELGQTVLFRARLSQLTPAGDRVLVDPNSLQLKLLDPQGTVTMVTGQKVLLGNWKAQSVVTVKGRWLAKWISDPSSGPAPGLQSFHFDVYDPGV